MPLQTMAAELEGTFPRLPYLHAIQIINRAWARVRDVRLWSWQFIVDAQLYTPDEIRTGTVSAVQFSTSIYVDATAAAAINAANGIPVTLMINNVPRGAGVYINGKPIDPGATADIAVNGQIIASPLAYNVPPVASPVLGVGRQIRVGLSTGIVPGTGNIYSIIAWDGANTLTIDKPFAEATVSNSAYRIYRCYFVAPALPFADLNTADANYIRPMTIVNRQGNYSVSGRRLFSTQAELNRIDPSRSASDSYFWRIAAYQRNSLGQPTYEMYPHPVLASAYGVTYYTRWPDITDTQDLPLVPYGLRDLVMDLARAMCCQWSTANMATYPELQQTNWVAAQANYKQDYMDGLKMCLRQDDEIMPQVPFRQGPVFDLPLGGAFLQNHDLLGMLQ